MTQPANHIPDMISETSVHATGGVYFFYRAEAVCAQGSVDSIWFEGVPSWLATDADSIYGIPPDAIDDTGFVVIASNSAGADTAAVILAMIPCMVAYGDTRTGHVMHEVIVDSFMTLAPAVVVHSGDLVNDGTFENDWVMFNSITEEMRANAEFFPALGNHEEQSQLYFDNFELPNNEQWYSVDRYGVHFIILNSCVETGVGSEQYNWLEADLASVADSIDFIAAVFHHPPYSTGPHIEDEAGLRDTWIPLFEQYGVDIVFNGHDHDYERSYCGGIYYIVTGGGGAPLRDQARPDPCSQLFLKMYHFCKISVIDKRMVVTVYDSSKSIRDQFTLNAKVRHQSTP